MTVDEIDAIGPGDTTGSETLARYMYQCKVAVQKWLRTIESPTETYILCEFVDDISTVTPSDVTFSQVKTRDRGSWSASKVLQDGGGIDALIRSYGLAQDGGLTTPVHLELVLEGPEATSADTRAFFNDPTSASDATRTKLAALGLDPTMTDDFLERLSIVPQYHARQSIDAVTIRLLMALVPGHTSDVEAIYDRLLDRVVAAHLGSAESADPDHPLASQPIAGPQHQQNIHEHVLTRSELLMLLPPVPALQQEQRTLIEAANGGALAMTDLEWKLRVAGAGESTVVRAQSRRSRASAHLAARPTLTSDVDTELEVLADRVLEHAEAVTADVVGSAPSPGQAARPAEVVYGRLVQQAGRLGDLDHDEVLAGNGDLVLGFLCELSDQCHFAWRSV